MRILIVAGARPNFVKIAPILREMKKYPSLQPFLVHTGQHYDQALSKQFFSDLQIPEPDVQLGVGSGSHAFQTAEVLRRMEPVLQQVRPELLLVVGDVNSTLAAALAAAKLGIRVAHVEAGLRSNDRAMPEEINRILVDALSDLLFITEVSGWQNLLHEGIALEKLHLVGNVMIDALEWSRPTWERSDIHSRLGLQARRDYALLTLHRPSNVDSSKALSRLLRPLSAIARELPIIFPVHPRVRPRLQRHHGLTWRKPGATGALPSAGIVCVDPLGYLDCVALMSRARMVLTDSGGIQEETTILGVPCLTLRETTERPVTISHGTNCIVGTDAVRIVRQGLRVLQRPQVRQLRPPLWDGRSAARIVKALMRHPELADSTHSDQNEGSATLSPEPSPNGSRPHGAAA